MSYLQQKSGGPSSTKAIISVWVNLSGVSDKDYKPHVLPSKCFQPFIEDIAGGRDGLVSGGSYYPSGLVQLGQPRFDIYPLTDKVTYLDNMVPFLTWGQTDVPYDLVEWKKKVLDKDYYYFGPNGGHLQIICQYPERVETVKPDEIGQKPTVGLVPPSMIGSHEGKLRIILQTNGKAKYTGYAYAQASAQKVTVLTPVGHPEPFPSTNALIYPYAYVDFSVTGDLWTHLPNPVMQGRAIKYTDVSDLECGQHPETFVMDTDIDIQSGWHHILLSWDFTGGYAKGDKERGLLADIDGRYDDTTGEKMKEEPGLITAEAVGDDPGPFCRGGDNELPYGQWSGRHGENALEVGYLGAPYEECGKYGLAYSGTMESTCRAWLCVDGQPVHGKKLNHKWAYKNGYLDNKNAIAPPNAFVCLGEDFRDTMVTSLTSWERFYRTHLGGFTGPAAKIEKTGEPRRYDYERGKYEFKPGGLTSGPFAMPAGEAYLDRNKKVSLAELHIWTGKSLNVENFVGLFAKGGKPTGIREMDEKLGKPSMRLHWATNWLKEKKKDKDAKPPAGNDDDQRTEADRQQSQKDKEEAALPHNEAGFAIVGHIERDYSL